MNQSHRPSRPVVKDNGVHNAHRASGKPKSNATSFKKGRMKTGGRKAGTPNKTTVFFREAVLAAAEAAGNETGRDGHIGYLTEVALKCPSSFVPLLARAMPQQPEPEETDEEGSEGEIPVIHTVKELAEQLILRGVAPDILGRELLRMSGKEPPEQEHSGTADVASPTDDRGVEVEDDS